jgi:hypothetical protein
MLDRMKIGAMRSLLKLPSARCEGIARTSKTCCRQASARACAATIPIAGNDGRMTPPRCVIAGETNASAG